MSEELSKFYELLLGVLDEAIKIDGAVKGNVQLVDRVRGGLEIVVHRGFAPAFIQRFGHVRPDDPTSCARAYRYQRRVIIPDVATDLLVGPYLSICKENGFQSAQATPIMGEDGHLKGVFSTYFPTPHQLSDKASKALDECASKLSHLIMEHEKVIMEHEKIGQGLGRTDDRNWKMAAASSSR